MAGNIPELITRAVVVSDNHLLCVHRKGASNIFLPGGHIDPGESARESLVRELEEELGLSCSPAGFLGTVEHTFLQKDEPLFEINLLFRVETSKLECSTEVSSREDHLEFMWIPCTEENLRDRNLQPWILQAYLPRYAETGRFPPFLSTAESR